MAVARDPAVIAQIHDLRAEAVGLDRAALAAAIRDQDAMWGPVARAAGVNADGTRRPRRVEVTKTLPPCA